MTPPTLDLVLPACPLTPPPSLGLDIRPISQDQWRPHLACLPLQVPLVTVPANYRYALGLWRWDPVCAHSLFYTVEDTRFYTPRTFTFFITGFVRC